MYEVNCNVWGEFHGGLGLDWHMIRLRSLLIVFTYLPSCEIAPFIPWVKWWARLTSGRCPEVRFLWPYMTSKPTRGRRDH